MTNKNIFRDYCPLCIHYESGELTYSCCTEKNISWLLKNNTEYETCLCGHYEQSFEGVMKEIIKKEDRKNGKLQQ